MKIPKIIVRYLPQYHQVPENDAWWGKGFTDWTAVRGGEPLFNGHQQPRRPLNNNYYDLMDIRTMEWQAALAKKYGIGGFSFYHYWFKDDKRILEKPAENLLQWKSLDMPFCFTWANQTWARTWSRLIGINSWSNTYQTDTEGTSGEGILLEQKYGMENEWKRHIEYLLPFFCDERYLKKDNKPLFIISTPELIRCLPDMLECWNQILKINGFSGLYLIGETNSFDGPYTNLNELQARVLRCPDVVLKGLQPNIIQGGVKVYDYDLYWDTLLKKNWSYWNNKPSYICVAFDFDSTPRHGFSGIVLYGTSIKKSKRYFEKLWNQMVNRDMDYVFINAWNEWGEGMYLEPDENNGYGYLEMICDVAKAYGNEEFIIPNEELITLDVDNRIRQKLHGTYSVEILDQWLTIKEKNKSIADYLCNIGYTIIAIYGFGIMGRHLLTELEEDNRITVKYIVDQQAIKFTQNIPVYKLSKDLPKVDAIIVTPAGQYSQIRMNIREYVTYPVYSLEHILFEL